MKLTQDARRGRHSCIQQWKNRDEHFVLCTVLFSAELHQSVEKKLKIQPSPNTRTDERTLTVLCVCVFVLQNILLHHPLFPAETFACPERFWRGHCEKHRMVKLCCCWTGTVQKCSGNKRSEVRDKGCGIKQSRMVGVRSNFYLQSAENTRVFNTLMSCQLTKTTTEDVEVP